MFLSNELSISKSQSEVHCKCSIMLMQVYKWMMQQHWYRFDFALATKLADYLGKQRKFAKCREIFDDIINQGRVPSESTFHILIVAYLSSSAQGSLEDACDIYNRMIQLGGYLPQLSLHNALFRALVSGPGGSSKHHLKQAEFIYHNLVTCGLDVHKDVYGGLIWLHSYQDAIDTERMKTLRKEMAQAGFKEGRDVFLSILRASSKVGDTEEAEGAWSKLLHLGITMPPIAYVYKMEVYAKVGEYMKSLDIFSEMKQNFGSPTVAAYHEIIEVLCKAQNVDLAEALMVEFMESGLKPLRPSFIDLMNMYFVLNLHDKVDSAFQQCLEKCQPDRAVYGIYLDSLVQLPNIDKAEEIFNLMQGNATIGVSKRSCNSILGGYLSSGDDSKAEKIYHFMCQKKYDVEPLLMEKLNGIMSAREKTIKKPPNPKLSKEQREILVGMLLGGLQIDSDERQKKHMVRFQFNEDSNMHSVLKKHIYEQFHEWLHPSFKSNDYSDEIPNRFLTIEHPHFGFYAEQFWPNGQPMIPKLIHRWLSPFVLAHWYMYGGHKTSRGDVLLKLRGRTEGVETVVKSLKAKSLNCRVKKKGRVFWIGLLGNNSILFRKLIEPYVLDCWSESDTSERDGEEALGNSISMDDNEDLNFSVGSDVDDYSDSDS